MAAIAVAPAAIVSGRSSLKKGSLWPSQARRLLFSLEFPTYSRVRVCHSESEPIQKGGVVCQAAPISGGVADKNVVEAVKNVLEMARRASTRRTIIHTNFFTPPVVNESLMALEKLADVRAVAQGGYPQAERCRISIGHPDVMEMSPDVISAVRISGNFEFDPCAHGDFLGAILNTGIVRDKVGDILLQGEKGAQVLIVPELVDFLVSALVKVGNVSVSCSEIPLLALEYEPPRTKSLRSIESSLRVDALASAGFKISRSKLVSLISNGDVRVNWSPVVKNGATLKTGDMVSVSGHGRLKVGEIVVTRKGKFSVELIRYL